MSAGRAMGSTMDQNVRNTPVSVDAGRLFHRRRDGLENCFMMNTPAASHISGTTSADGVLYIPMVFNARNFGRSRTIPGTAMTTMDGCEERIRPLELEPCQRIARQGVEEHPSPGHEQGHPHGVGEPARELGIRQPGERVRRGGVRDEAQGVVDRVGVRLLRDVARG